MSKSSDPKRWSVLTSYVHRILYMLASFIQQNLSIMPKICQTLKHKTKDIIFALPDIYITRIREKLEKYTPPYKHTYTLLLGDRVACGRDL